MEGSVVGRSGDAFGRFYRENLHAVRGYLARLLPNPAEADDIAHEAFTRVLAAADPDRPVPPKAYLFSTAHNLAMNQHRRHRVRGNPDLLDDHPEIADDTPAADRDLIARERVRLLWDAVNQLPPKCRQVFIMRKVEQLSNPEIAEKLGISVSAVEKHIRLGLISCRAYLASFEIEGGQDSGAGTLGSGRVDHG